MSGTDIIAFHVCKDLLTFKYFDKSVVDGAIKAYCHKHRRVITPEEHQEVYDIVTNGLKRLGY